MYYTKYRPAMYHHAASRAVISSAIHCVAYYTPAMCCVISTWLVELFVCLQSVKKTFLVHILKYIQINETHHKT